MWLELKKKSGKKQGISFTFFWFRDSVKYDSQVYHRHSVDCSSTELRDRHSWSRGHTRACPCSGECRTGACRTCSRRLLLRSSSEASKQASQSAFKRLKQTFRQTAQRRFLDFFGGGGAGASSSSSPPPPDGKGTALSSWSWSGRRSSSRFRFLSTAFFNFLNNI